MRTLQKMKYILIVIGFIAMNVVARHIILKLNLMPQKHGTGGPKMDELKPCPFCGGKAEIASLSKIAIGVFCNKCSAEIGIYRTKQEAIEAWNRRANETE